MQHLSHSHLLKLLFPSGLEQATYTTYFQKPQTTAYTQTHLMSLYGTPPPPPQPLSWTTRGHHRRAFQRKDDPLVLSILLKVPAAEENLGVCSSGDACFCSGGVFCSSEDPSLGWGRGGPLCCAYLLSRAGFGPAPPPQIANCNAPPARRGTPAMSNSIVSGVGVPLGPQRALAIPHLVSRTGACGAAVRDPQGCVPSGAVAADLCVCADYTRPVAHIKEPAEWYPTPSPLRQARPRPTAPPSQCTGAALSTHEIPRANGETRPMCQQHVRRRRNPSVAVV